MSDNDRPVHLAELFICHREPHTAPSVKVPVWLPQAHLDGLQSVIRYLEGLERGGGGRVPGHFDLVQHYRVLVAAIWEAEANRPKDSEDGREVQT